MTAGNDFDPDIAEPELFSALLTPHRSLNRTGFLVLMAFLSVVSFAAGVAFLLMGAWPVFGFFGLDVLVIYWAFQVNFRRATARRGNLGDAVRTAACAGSAIAAMSSEFVLNPLWVQLDQKIACRIRHRTALSGLQRPPGRDRRAFWDRTKRLVLPKP